MPEAGTSFAMLALMPVSVSTGAPAAFSTWNSTLTLPAASALAEEMVAFTMDLPCAYSPLDISSSEPWKLPEVSELPRFPVTFRTDPEGHQTFKRDERGSRAWVKPGTPGMEFRIGGLEKSTSGNISYDPANHEHMVRTRAAKIAGIANDIPLLEVDGPEEGDLLIVGWGGTHGSLLTAAQRLQRKGLKVAHAHLRYLNPMPRNTGDVLRRYRKVLVPELNGGQLSLLLRATYLIDCIPLTKVQGRPFLVGEIEQKVEELLA